MSHVVAMEPQELGRRDAHRILMIVYGKENTSELRNNSLGFIMRRADNVSHVLR